MLFGFKAEKQRAELQREFDELNERLEEVGGTTQAQVSSWLHTCTSKVSIILLVGSKYVSKYGL